MIYKIIEQRLFIRKKVSVFLTQVYGIIYPVCQIPGCVGHANLNNYLNKYIYHANKNFTAETLRT